MNFKANICYALDPGPETWTILRSTGSRKGTHHDVIFEGRPESDAFEQNEGWNRMIAELQAEKACITVPMSAGLGFARWLTAPFPSLNKARKVFPTLLDIQLPLPLEQCRYLFLHLHRTPDNHVQTLAVAARRSEMEQTLQRLGEHGLDPLVLDHEGLALWSQSLLELPPEEEEARVIAHLATDHLTLVLSRGNRFVSTHSIRVAGHDLLDRQQAEEPPPERAVTQVERRIRQVLHASAFEVPGEPIRWLWSGPCAEDLSALQTLETCIQEINHCAFGVHHEPNVFLLRALASRVLKPSAFSVNLRTDDFLHPVEQKHQARKQTTATIASVAAALAICGLNLAWRFSVDRYDHRLQNQIQAVAKEITRTPKVQKAKEVLLAERALKQRGIDVYPFRESFTPSLSVLLADVMTISSENNIQIASMALNRDHVSLQGTTPGRNRGIALEERLLQAGYAVSYQTHQSSEGSRVNFTMAGGRR